MISILRMIIKDPVKSDNRHLFLVKTIHDNGIFIEFSLEVTYSYSHMDFLHIPLLLNYFLLYIIYY